MGKYASDGGSGGWGVQYLGFVGAVRLMPELLDYRGPEPRKPWAERGCLIGAIAGGIVVVVVFWFFLLAVLLDV
jgi:hypothetical protein